MEAESRRVRSYGIIARFDESFNDQAIRLANLPLNLGKIGYDPGRAHTDVRVELPYLLLCHISKLKQGIDVQSLKRVIEEIGRYLVGQRLVFDRVSASLMFLSLGAPPKPNSVRLSIAHGLAKAAELYCSVPTPSLDDESRALTQEERTILRELEVRSYNRLLARAFFPPRVTLAYDERYIGQHMALEQPIDPIVGRVCAVEFAAIGAHCMIESRGEVDDFQL